MHCVHNVLFFNCDFVTCSRKPIVIAFTFLCIHNTCTLVYLKDFNFKSATRLLKRQHSRVKNFTYWQVTFSFRSLILFSYYQNLQCLAPGARVYIIRVSSDSPLLWIVVYKQVAVTYRQRSLGLGLRLRNEA